MSSRKLSKKNTGESSKLEGKSTGKMSHLEGPGVELDKGNIGSTMAGVFKNLDHWEQADDQDVNYQKSPAEEQAFLREMNSTCSDVPDIPGWPRMDIQTCCMRGMKYRQDRATECYRNYVSWRHSLIEAAGPLDESNPTIQTQLSKGVMKLPGTLDRFGRAIILTQLRFHNPKVFSALQMVLLFAYIVEQILRDKTPFGLAAQLNGVCIVHSMQHLQMSNLDHRIPKELFAAINKKVPLRVGAILACNPPIFFRMVMNIVTVFMSKKLRSRIHIVIKHEDLEKFLPPSAIPPEIQFENATTNSGSGPK
eukprot:Platyproteum_vivax@DN3507_c0_g1_i1.p1